MTVAGIQRFAEIMGACGLVIHTRGPIVIVEVEVSTGVRAGEVIPVGADPPRDFPVVPPPWVHLPLEIELTGGSRQPSELGPEWSKWSRPHKQWRDAAHHGSQWLAHIRALLAAATR